MCDWFAKCNNEPTVMVDHPVLGWVATCDACVQKLGLEPIRCATPCGEVVRLTQECAEAYDPRTLVADDYEASTHGLVHAECMLAYGWEMS